ncbi:MAG TPA: response regulator transcription factor [Acidobacteriaceae bacterium]|nr:response regulator transcription factor [Acidobacteriaceae bacterium]
MGYISVVIADRQPVVLQGLRKLLDESPFRVVASCTDAVSCIEAIRKLKPQIAILGTSMPGLTGLEVLAIVKSESLPTRLVFFTGSLEQYELLRSAATGAHGVILKEVAPEALLDSLNQIALGQRLPRRSAEQAQALQRSNVALREKVMALLTDRERQIMRLVSEGLSNKAIGRRLNIADGTIKVHLHNIFQKLEINNRTLLAALVISQREQGRAATGEAPAPELSSQQLLDEEEESAAIVSATDSQAR